MQLGDTQSDFRLYAFQCFGPYRAAVREQRETERLLAQRAGREHRSLNAPLEPVGCIRVIAGFYGSQFLSRFAAMRPVGAVAMPERNGGGHTFPFGERPRAVMISGLMQYHP